MTVSLISTLGGTAGFGTEVLAVNDDSSTSQISLGSVFENGLNFFGTTYNSLWINNNGGVSFSGPVSTYTPQTISSGTTPGIFPYWADVDTRGGPGTVSPGGTSQGTNIVHYILDTSNDRLVVTWDDVGYYSRKTDHVNAFQLVLTDASSVSGRTAGDFDIEFRYEWVDWTAGSASGGSGGVGGTTSRAGYSAGNGTFFELPQAGNEAAMLALESTPGNTGQDGLWRWSVFNGNVPPTVSISSTGDVTEGNSGTTDMVFLVERTGDLTGTLTVDWTADGFFPFPANSADVVGDLPRGGTVSFEEGETTKTITIGIRGDTIIEPDENIVVTLSNAVASTGEEINFAARQAFSQILNDDFPPPPNQGLRANLYGDPHITTLDGLGYDFQAVGEFILVESTSGDPLNVQVRMTPVSDVVSWISAVATEVAGTRIMLDATRDTALSINGVLTPLNTSNSPLSVGDTGAQIYANDGAYTIIMPNGEQLQVGVSDSGYLNVATYLSDSRPAGSVRGLTGNADGNSANDLALPNGTILPQPIDFDTLYTTFADAWRITEAQALFDRAPGETTADYQDSSYPRGHVTVEDLPADIRAAAEAAVEAAGITDPAIVENAVLDYALTGDLSLVTSAASLTGPTTSIDPSNTPADRPTLMISSVNSQVEGDGGTSTFRFTVDRFVSTQGALDVNYTVGGQVNASDLSGPMSGTISFADGETEKTIEVAVSGDTVIENDEALTVTINAPGASVLYATNASTTIVLDDDGMPVQFGTDASEMLQGDSGDNRIYALAGDDTIEAGRGDDQISGGSGNDTAVYSGNQSSYTLVVDETSTTITDRRADGNGTDALSDIEYLSFDTGIDGNQFNLSIFGGSAGLSAAAMSSVIELYIAYFNRAPDAIGLNYWGTEYSNGYTLPEMAASFFVQNETRATYDAVLDTNGNLTDIPAFVTSVYANVLGRTADAEGFAYWVNELENNPNITPPIFILAIINGAKNPSNPTAQSLVDQQYLESKADVGAYFAVTKGMSDVNNAIDVMMRFDGTQNGLNAAVGAIDGHYADALDANSGEFLMPLVGVLDDPFLA